MKRISDENIELKIQGTLTSAVVDKAGDRLAERAIIDIKNQMENNPKKRRFTVDHSRRVVGEILEIWTNRNDDGILELNGTVGIYEGNDDVIERIEADELSGFSIEAHYFENTDENEWSNADQILRLQVDGNQRGEIHKKLSTQGLKFKTRLEKSATGIAVFAIIVENIHKIALAIILLHGYYSKIQSEESANSEAGNIEFPNGEEIDIDQDVEDVLNDVEDMLGEETDIDYESLSREEIERELHEILN